MVDKIEMSLDDIIKSSKKTGRGASGGFRGRGGRGRPAPQRRRGGGAISGSPRGQAKTGGGGVIKGRRTGSAGISKAKFSRGDVNSAWKHDMYDGPRRAGILKSVIGDSAKILVSNLDFGVSDQDIRELFTEFGALKKAAVHYDKSGRSLGTADVIFDRHADALKAIKQYHGVPLDGRPMNIQLATSDVTSLVRQRRDIGSSAPVRRRPSSGAPPSRRGGNAGGGRRGTLGGSRGRGGGRGGRVGGRGQKPTAEELDAELDAYVNDMKI